MKINILGISCELATRYSEGHIATACEAEVLNRALTRGAAKGLHKVLSRALEERSADDASALPEDERAALSAIANEYLAEFAQGFALGHERNRAVEVEARRIALAALEAALYKRGQRLDALGEGEKETKLSELIYTPSIRREAEKRVDDAQKLAARGLEELLEGGELA